jgi:hypothetical protein
VRKTFIGAAGVFAVIGLSLASLGIYMAAFETGDSRGGGIFAVLVGVGTLYVGYIFASAARRAKSQAHHRDEDLEPASGGVRRRKPSLARITLVCIALGLIGVLTPIGGISVGARVVVAIVVVVGALIGAAAVADAQNTKRPR